MQGIRQHLLKVTFKNAATQSKLPCLRGADLTEHMRGQGRGIRLRDLYRIDYFRIDFAPHNSNPSFNSSPWAGEARYKASPLWHRETVRRIIGAFNAQALKALAKPKVWSEGLSSYPPPASFRPRAKPAWRNLKNPTG